MSYFFFILSIFIRDVYSFVNSARHPAASDGDFRIFVNSRGTQVQRYGSVHGSFIAALMTTAGNAKKIPVDLCFNDLHLN